MKPLILGIETSTLSCSVALCAGTEVVHSEQKCDERHVHAAHLLPMIDRALQSNGWTVKDLDAVAVCAGPGSYTGLRIGVSTAKGICHANGIPLIAINSLEIQAHAAPESSDTVIAVMDARRDEVYTQSFALQNRKMVALDETRALVINAQLPLNALFPAASSSCTVIGDAALKTQSLLQGLAPDWTFVPDHPQAKYMAVPAWEAYSTQQFEDVAYFEPHYLKEFQAGTPKDPLGLRAASLS